MDVPVPSRFVLVHLYYQYLFYLQKTFLASVFTNAITHGCCVNNFCLFYFKTKLLGKKFFPTTQQPVMLHFKRSMNTYM
jgi:hypothetical protein